MKIRILEKTFFILLIITILTGCDLFKGDDPEPIPTDEYLLSYEQQKSYLPSIIQIALQEVIGDYPELESLMTEFKHPITVYTITYTTTYNDEPVTASGMVSIPLTVGEPFPVFSFQNGTNTLHSEAPSVNPDSEFFLLLEFIASTGFVVSVPDYLGFGASEQMFHPYLDKESTVQIVTDMIKAVKELVNNHLDIEISDDLYINGYSQGGWATMQLQKSLEQDNTTGMNLKASACGAGPYDLNFINNYILAQTDYPEPYFIGYIYNSYIQTGSITNATSDVFKSPYDERISTLYDGSKSGEEINAQLTTSVAELFTDYYRQNATTDNKFSSVISSLTNNSVGAWKTNIPTMIIHGTDDTFVPPQVSFNMYQNFLLQGVNPANLTYVPVPGAGHREGIIPAEAAALKWFIELKQAY